MTDARTSVGLGDRLAWLQASPAFAETTGAERGVLFVLLAHAAADGICRHVSMAVLGERTGGSRSSVIRAVAALAKRGLIRVVQRGGGRSRAGVFELAPGAWPGCMGSCLSRNGVASATVSPAPPMKVVSPSGSPNGVDSATVSPNGVAGDTVRGRIGVAHATVSAANGVIGDTESRIGVACATDSPLVAISADRERHNGIASDTVSPETVSPVHRNGVTGDTRTQKYTSTPCTPYHPRTSYDGSSGEPESSGGGEGSSEFENEHPLQRASRLRGAPSVRAAWPNRPALRPTADGPNAAGSIARGLVERLRPGPPLR